MVSWTEVLIPVASAGVGLWIGQYVQWNFKKKELKYAEKKALLKSTREAIYRKEFPKKDFINTVIYSQLRPYLSRELKNNLETYFASGPPKRLFVEGENYRNSILHLVLDDLSALERKWGLL